MLVEEELELTVTWRVGKGGGGPGERLDTPPYKAYYCLTWGKEIIDHKEFTRAELEQEIDRLSKAGEDITDHEKALRKFSRLQ